MFEADRGDAGCVVRRDSGIGRGLPLSASSPGDSNRAARKPVVPLPTVDRGTSARRLPQTP